jgi:hypothetical protein
MPGPAADVQRATGWLDRRQVVDAQRFPQGVVLDVQTIDLARVPRKQIRHVVAAAAGRGRSGHLPIREPAGGGS